MARPQSARPLTRTRAVPDSAQERIAAANAKRSAVKSTTAAQRRARREGGAIDGRLLSPGERLIARQQQEILQRQAVIQGQNLKIISYMERFATEIGLQDEPSDTSDDAAPSDEDRGGEPTQVSPEADTVELEPDPSLLEAAMHESVGGGGDADESAPADDDPSAA